MSKKQGQMQKKVHQASAITGSKKQGRAAAYAALTDQQKMTVATLPPAVQMYIGADQYERGWHDNQRFQAGFAQLERNFTRLIRRCDYVDVAAATLEGKELKDVLGGGLATAIQADYEGIAHEWGEMNQALIRNGLRSQPDFYTTHTDIHPIVNERLAALKALANGDDTLIQSLKLLDHEMRDLLNRVKRKGRSTVNEDWLTLEAKRLEGEGYSAARIVNYLKVLDRNQLTAEQNEALQAVDASANPEAMIKKRLQRG